MSETKNNYIVAKKSLGQNFLKSKMVLNEMLLAGQVNNTDIILEIGPGKGVLTEKLLTTAKKVFAVEKDARLIYLLKEKFSREISTNKLVLIAGDILDFNPSDYKLLNKYKIIANIPYYITGQFLRKFLETTNQPTQIIVLVQKEIAQRITTSGQANSKKKKESLLSISVKAYGQPKIIMKVSKENFSPVPKVDSAVLAINNISKNFFTENNLTERKFFTLLHTGFAHKRKILIGNLKETGLQKEKLENLFELNTISKTARAEDLTLKNWADLCQKI